MKTTHVIALTVVGVVGALWWRRRQATIGDTSPSEPTSVSGRVRGSLEQLGFGNVVEDVRDRVQAMTLQWNEYETEAPRADPNPLPAGYPPPAGTAKHWGIDYTRQGGI